MSESEFKIDTAGCETRALPSTPPKKRSHRDKWQFAARFEEIDVTRILREAEDAECVLVEINISGRAHNRPLVYVHRKLQPFVAEYTTKSPHSCQFDQSGQFIPTPGSDWFYVYHGRVVGHDLGEVMHALHKARDAYRAAQRKQVSVTAWR